jgi:hypothetical protein
LLVFIISVLI